MSFLYFLSGDYFTDEPKAVTVPANLQRYTIEQVLDIVDDNIDEDRQSFAIVAEIGPDVPDGVSCYKIAEEETDCFGRHGAIRIKILDNDRK